MVSGFGESKPAWLEGLLADTFFGPCLFHQDHRKNEKNVFCLECCLTICPHCLLSSHNSHHLLQVRRYVYHDVVRLGDLEKLIDCDYIQPYTINSAKVIFLKARPQSRSSKCPTNICNTCERILQEQYHFCSLSCKVNHMVRVGQDLSNITRAFDKSDFVYEDFEGLRADAMEDEALLVNHDSSLLDEPYRFHDSSCGDDGSAAAAMGGEELRRMKKVGCILISSSNRRKGYPHRSPFS